MIFYSTLSGNLFKTFLPAGFIEFLKVSLINFTPTSGSTEYTALSGSFIKRITGTGFTPVWQAVPCSSSSFKRPVTFTTSNSAIATITKEGIINKVSTGTVLISASNGEGRGAEYVLNTAQGVEPFFDYFVNFIPGYLSYEYTEALNTLIKAANPNLVGSALINEFTTYGNSISGTYVRNLSCWTALLDFTGISVYNTRGGKDRNVTAITRRHVVNATHYSLSIGDRVLFITKDNQRVERTIIGKQIAQQYDYDTDLCVYLLDADLPETIKHYRVWNELERLQKRSYTPLYKTQPEAPAGYDYYAPQSSNADNTGWSKMLVVENNKDVVLWIGAQYPNETRFSKGLGIGDSGSPTFFVLSAEPFLWGTLTQTYRATTVFNKNINETIGVLDTAAGINTGYTLEVYSLSAFPAP